VPPPDDVLQRLEERVDVGHPVLEQVAHAAGAVGQQLVGVGHLDVLGEHQHRRPGGCAAQLDRRTQALVGVRRRHAHVDDRHVGPVLGDRLHQRRPVADRGDDLGAGLLEQPHQALPEQHRVVGQDGPQRAVPGHAASSLALVGHVPADALSMGDLASSVTGTAAPR
jgi:hypothetical protein